MKPCDQCRCSSESQKNILKNIYLHRCHSVCIDNAECKEIEYWEGSKTRHEYKDPQKHTFYSHHADVGFPSSVYNIKSMNQLKCCQSNTISETIFIYFSKFILFYIIVQEYSVQLSIYLQGTMNVHHGLNGPNAVRLVAVELILVLESAHIRAQLLREKIVLETKGRISLVQIMHVVNIILYRNIP